MTGSASTADHIWQMQSSNRTGRSLLFLALLAGLFAGLVGPRLLSVQAAPQMQTVAHIVISQVYGGGGNSNAPYLNDYVELFNPSDVPLSINGWSIQYATATGNGLFSANVTNVTGTIAPGQYYLVQLAGGTNGIALPTPDAIGTINLNATDGKVILANTTAGLPCNGGSTPCSASDLASIIDLVGYGTANFSEGNSPAPALNSTKADLRSNNSCGDTDNNNADFTTGTPTPRNSLFSPIITCSNLSLTATAVVNQTGTAAVNQTGTAASNLTGTAVSNLTATASAANLTGTAAALTGTPTFTPTATPTGPTPTPLPAAPLSVLINEVGWMGTSSSRTNDEWIELYNPGTTARNLNGWKLTIDDGNLEEDLANFTSTDVIPAGGFFLLARPASPPNPSGTNCSGTYDIDIFKDVVEDKCFSVPLVNSPNGQTLRLYDPPDATHPNGTTIDVANSDRGNWPAGIASPTYASMERRRIELEGPNTWVTFGGPTSAQFAHNRDNVLVKGTPKRANWILTVTPTKTSTPPPKPTRIKTATPKPVGRPIINEYLPRPGFDWNQDGQINVFDEFIEVMNIGPVDISVAGWKLEVVSGASFTLPSVTLKPGQRMVFYGLQTNILLSDGGGTVRLLNVNGQVWDAHTYSIAKEPDKSWCRLPDGTFSWFGDCVPTPGTANSRTGEVPVAADEDELQPKTCNFPDTMPLDFKIAECFGYGSNMWRSMFWDLKGWGDHFVPENTSKWNTFVE